MKKFQQTSRRTVRRQLNGLLGFTLLSAFLCSGCKFDPGTDSLAELGLAAYGQQSSGCPVDYSSELTLKRAYQDIWTADPAKRIEGAVDMVGLEGSITMSMDKQGWLYVSAESSSALNILESDENNGTLLQRQVLQDKTYHDDVSVPDIVAAVDQPGLGGHDFSAISPDGQNVYANGNGEDALLVFWRDADTGLLSLRQIFQDKTAHTDPDIDSAIDYDGLEGILGVIVSSDGKNVYTASGYDNAITVFDRDQITGQLSVSESWQQVGDPNPIAGAKPQNGLTNITFLTLSPDDKNLYATGSTGNALIVFGRNENNGKLTFLQAFSDNGVGIGEERDGLASPYQVTVSPDGKNVYVVSVDDGALLVFNRNQNDGQLTYMEVFQDKANHPDPDIASATDQVGLMGSLFVSVLKDNKTVITTSTLGGGILVWERNQDDGSLTHKYTYQDKTNIVYVPVIDEATDIFGVAGSAGMQESLNCRYVYIESVFMDSVLVFERK